MICRRSLLKGAGALVCGGATSACTTGYQRAKRDSILVREAGPALRPVPLSPRVGCFRRTFAAKGLDASQLVFGLSGAGSSAGGLPGGHAPQENYLHDVNRIVHECGFTVVFDSKLAPAKYHYLISTTVSGFVPLSGSSLGRDDLDLVLLDGRRERLMARGTVQATALIQAFNGKLFTTWAAAKTEGVFWQLKHKRELAAASKTGWATVGTMSEVIEVNAVQTVSSLTVEDAVLSALAAAFQFSC